MGNVAGRHNTLDDTTQEIQPVVYANMHTAVMTLLVKYVLTSTAGRSFSVMYANMHTAVMTLLVKYVLTSTAGRSFSVMRRHGDN